MTQIEIANSIEQSNKTLDYIKSKISIVGGLVSIVKVIGYYFTKDTVVILFDNESGISNIAYPIKFLYLSDDHFREAVQCYSLLKVSTNIETLGQAALRLRNILEQYK